MNPLASRFRVMNLYERVPVCIDFKYIQHLLTYTYDAYQIK